MRLNSAQWIFGALVLVANPVAAAAPAAGGAASADPASLTSMLQVVVGLGVVLLAIFGFAWLSRRLGAFQGNVGGQLKVLGGVSLGPRERAVLMQVGEKQLLIGVSQGSLRTLHVLEEPVSPGASPGGGSQSSGFAARLRAATRQGEKS